MALDRIRLGWFRNHRATALEGTGKFNLLVGENGAGKTNILEAISLFAPGRGLRRAALPDMAGQAGDGAFAVSGDLLRDGAGVRLGTGTAPDKPGRRIVRVNGADASALSLSEWLGLFWLTPAMDRLFMDSPGGRRRFVDRLALALDPAHAAHAARTEAAIRERNRLLSAPQEPDARWLDAIEAQIAEAGGALASGRARLIEALNAKLETLPPSPFARPALIYQAGGPTDVDALAQALREQRRRDRAAQRTLTGPHRDDLGVTMAAKNQPAAECSTGEQKAMLIAITLAHAELSGDTDRPRLLLLDEVAAHLDPIRRGALFERLEAGAAQVWMTGTELAPFDALKGKAAQWHVAEGSVRKE
ncbi:MULTISPECIES: DNA replication/repair protein RecF [unclassified Novosphingobium]|uniref:DNA replication/repair protein RecF n=1 Tax=unclassified Novosphingobium TaxID=2644732 RepID=UPI00086F0CB8|nr:MULTISPECIES: DNA replication/repair protein RecF [unclassified Novosphingobium]MBN9144932.1 DNA replication/repair protein RecF [Novosphingobium sp.]MDR6707972.1 DNA replication and repair protein RecF [Novosphingobium sp. 1748]ODU82457.1 MAG: DNA replication/repair protein RecF [Novosphingobium sp. SCN 63-17]OJX92161.1 MAG: DNA replication/repair protein RecF [Novosphingobium sp. 63-713]